MRNEKDIRQLEQSGAITTDSSGIRIIDASKLQTILTPGRSTSVKSLKEENNRSLQYSKNEVKKLNNLDLNVVKEKCMPEDNFPKGVGLDIGTSFLIAGRLGNDGKTYFKKFRDCFIELEPKSPINQKFLKKGLEDRKAAFAERDGKYYVLGEDAFIMANERGINTRRPMKQGVISPKEKEAFPILKEIINRLLGPPTVENEKLVYSVPGKPIDAEFDQLFHQDVLRSFIKSLGYDPHSMNEAEALAYSELVDEDLTGIAISMGAGMMNVAVLSAGDPIVTFSTVKSGDWIDQHAALATNMTHSLVQMEKESSSLDLINPDPTNSIHQAIAVYYGNLLVYTLEQIAYDLSNSPKLPKFKEPVTLVVGGGTSLPKGCLEKFKQALSVVTMPIQIKEVRQATDPLYAVANGLVLAATME